MVRLSLRFYYHSPAQRYLGLVVLKGSYHPPSCMPGNKGAVSVGGGGTFCVCVHACKWACKGDFYTGFEPAGIEDILFSNLYKITI